MDVQIWILVKLAHPIHGAQEAGRVWVLEPTAVLLAGLDIEVECLNKVPVDTHKVVAANLCVNLCYLDITGQYTRL